MKIEIILNSDIKEKVVKIYTNKIDDEIKSLEKYLQNSSLDKIICYTEKGIKLLSYSSIYRIYSLDKKTIVRTKDEEYTTKTPLQEIEICLPKKFIKISRSEVINLDYVENLDLSFRGTIEVKMKNGDVTYLARRRMKDFKEALGI